MTVKEGAKIERLSRRLTTATAKAWLFERIALDA
jgi:hypothetical protein